MREFYARCAELLGIEHIWTEPTVFPVFDRESGELVSYGTTKRGRWYGREPGHGRYAGYGTIRMFSASCIQVALTNPQRIQRTCTSVDEVYALLSDLQSP